MLRLALAVLHLLALGIGLGAVWARARALGGPLDGAAVRRAFAADSWWGVAAGVWLATGLWRLFAGTEKATEYYLRNGAFHVKMGLFVLILALEMWPMVTLVRWRMAARASGAGRAAELAPYAGRARRIATISYVQVGLVVLMVTAAVAMAHGMGARG